MAFKKLRGVRLPTKKQLLIRAICLNYETRPEWEKNKIKRLCERCAGEHRAALFRMMTTEDSVTKISNDYYLSASRLYELRKSFYESWDEK